MAISLRPAALASGGDIVIPTGRYGTRLVGTDLGRFLQPHARFDPDGYSAAEIPQVRQERKALAENAVAETEASVVFNESARAVEMEFRRQVESTGRVAPRAARDTAAVFRAFVETQSERLGVTPQEFAERFGGHPLCGNASA